MERLLSGVRPYIYMSNLSPVTGKCEIAANKGFPGKVTRTRVVLLLDLTLSVRGLLTITRGKAPQPELLCVNLKILTHFLKTM